jgi:hypothetical protein
VLNPETLPVALYGGKTSSLIVREEHKLKEFEIRVLRRLFGPKRQEVTGGWIQLVMSSFIIYILYHMLLR